MKIIKSINYNQQEIINDILLLHNDNEPIEIDCTYSKGIFYKNGIVLEPKYKFDLTPQTIDTIKASSENLPVDSNSIKCTIFDPPFVIAGKTAKDNKEGSSIIAKRFSSYTNYQELKTHYRNTLKELYRITKDNGIVIMKLQNTVSGGKQHFTHNFVMKEALKLGFYPKDEFILLTKSKITSFWGKMEDTTTRS